MRTYLFAFVVFQSAVGFADIDKKFYKKFWQLDPSSTYKDMVISPKYSSSFDEIIVQAETGYGTGKTQDESSSGPYSNLVDIYNSCLSDIGAAKGSCPAGVKSVKDIKYTLAKLEQCYANIIPTKEEQTSNEGSGTSQGLNYMGVQRSQTKIEKDLGLSCDKKTAIKILTEAKSFAGSGFTSSVTEESDTKDIKKDFETLHGVLIGKLTDANKALIEEINKKYLNSNKVVNKSFVEKVELEASEVNNVLKSYNDVVLINSYLPPITVFQRTKIDKPDTSNVKILFNGQIKPLSSFDNVTDKMAEGIGRKRNGQLQTIDKFINEQKKMISSFTELKKNAILNIASIVAERTKEGDHSMLYSIQAAINAQLKASDTDEVNPSVLLKQIRDALLLNNKLSFMNYIALERLQMAMSVTQVSQLKPLSDKINEITNKLNKMAYEYDLGSEFEQQVKDK